MNVKINGVSSCWSSYPIKMAIEKLHAGTIEPLFGMLDTEHVQLCPQHPDFISENLLDFLVETYPATQFRLHADVRLKEKRGYVIDLSNFSSETEWYFRRLAEYSKRLSAPTYSLHAGKRDGSLAELFEKAKRCQELFECPIAIEGHYPTRNGKWFIDSWGEYEELLESGMNFALDLSHLNILAENSKKWEIGLIKSMLNSPQCIEVHVSFNNGEIDNHLIASYNHQDQLNFFLMLMEHVNKSAAIFSEGNQTLHERLLKRGSHAN